MTGTKIFRSDFSQNASDRGSNNGTYHTFQPCTYQSSHLPRKYNKVTHFVFLHSTFLITYVVSVLVNLMFSGKLKKLDMVESLKDVE